MTGRTHDLAAFTALSLVVATQPLPEMRLSTVLVALTANFIGGLTPDIDQPTADLWHRLPAGGVWGKLFSPFLGGHRSISHSFFGIFVFGLGLKLLLDRASTFLLVDMNVVWWSFMIGFVSHLVMDTITHEGVPWFFPLHWKIGIPPVKALRVKTGGLVEKYVIFPLLIIASGWIYFSYYEKFLGLLKFYVNK